jgi:hypothetical protein
MELSRLPMKNAGQSDQSGETGVQLRFLKKKEMPNEQSPSARGQNASNLCTRSFGGRHFPRPREHAAN